jgi:predicted XRE-type DNA-binding protein
MSEKSQTESTWKLLEDQLIRGQNLWLRSELLARITENVHARKMTQAKMAALLNITQPRVCALMQGKVEQFRLDSLVDIAHRLGLGVSLKIEA